MLEKKARFSARRIFLESLSSRLYHDEPVGRFEPGKAGVAVIFRLDDGLKLLLIKRTVKEGDPWSGQVAFPGGRVDEKDSSFRETAVRETEEEVGINLRTNSRFLGYLGLFKARTRGMMVVPSVFLLTREVRVTPNREVASYRWVPIGVFQSDSSKSFYSIDHGGVKQSFPSYVVRNYVIWGLTERIISTLTSYL